jgi:hypothetical protein
MNPNVRTISVELYGMRTSKKPVPSYMVALQSPWNSHNRPRGKRIVDRDSLASCKEYAGKRTCTPGVIPTSDPWNSRTEFRKRRGQLVLQGQSRLVFSSCYRPQIRVNVTHPKGSCMASPEHRLRKPVDGLSCLGCALKGPLVSDTWRDAPYRKHRSFSKKQVSSEQAQRRLRSSHPEVSGRMRRGSDIEGLLKTQWSNDVISSRSTAACSRRSS